MMNRVRLAMRAYEAFWRDPDSEIKWFVFCLRHMPLRERYGAQRLWSLYRRHLRKVGIDPTVIIEVGGISFRRA